MKTKLLGLIALLSIFCALLLGGNEIFTFDPHSRAINNLMQLSGCEKQLSELGGILTTNINKELSHIPAEQKKKISNAIHQAFDSLTIKLQVHQRLYDSLNPEDIQQLLIWLESDLGKKITLQEELANTAQALAEFSDVAKRLEANTNRLALLKKLDFSANITQGSIDTATLAAIAITTGLTSSKPTNQRLPQSHLQSIYKQLRLKASSSVSLQMNSLLLYTYRNINDTELQQYIDFNLTRPAQKFNKAFVDGMKDAIKENTLGLRDMLLSEKE